MVQLDEDKLEFILYYIFYFLFLSCTCKLRTTPTRLQSLLCKSKNQISRSKDQINRRQKLRTAKIEMEIPSQTLFHKIHTQASVFDEFNPISDLFSLLNIKSKSHSQSQKSPFSTPNLKSLQSQVSSLNPSLTSLHNLHNPNPSCCRRHLIITLMASPHCPPWVKASHANGSASQSQDSQVYFLPFSSIFFSIWEYDFFPFKFMYISLIFSFFLLFWGCFNLLIHKNEGNHRQIKERSNQTLGRIRFAEHKPGPLKL